MKKILFVSTKSFPIIGGDTIFTAGLIYRLSMEHDLSLVTIVDNKDIFNHKIFRNIKIFPFPKLNGYFYKLLKLVMNRSLLQEYSPGIEKFLKYEKLKDYDFIIIDHLRSFSVCKYLFKKVKEKEKIIYMAHNVESKNQKEKLKFLPKERIFTLLSNNVHSLENKILEKCGSVWTLNQSDMKVLTRNHHNNNRVIKPFYPWDRVKSNKDISIVNNELLILGSLNWYPNIQGILHFVKDIFPEILKKNNKIKLNIVGQNPSQEILDLESSKINVYPNVKSVDSYIKKSDLLIIPNRYGTGSKIKLLESIMKGLPVVTYPENLIGFENLQISQPFLVNNEQEFCESVISIIADASKKTNFIEKNIVLLQENKMTI